MTINIPYAWRFKCSSLKQLNKWISAYKEIAVPDLINYISKQIVEVSTRSYDLHTLYPNLDSERLTIVSEWHKVVMEQKDKEKALNGTLYFFHRGGYAYVIVYSLLEHILTPIMDKMPNTEDFSYHDDVDNDMFIKDGVLDTVAKKDWLKRKRIWKSLIKGRYLDIENELNIKILPINSIQVPTETICTPYIPTFESRCNSIATDYICKNKMANTTTFKSIMDIFSWLKTDEAKEKKILAKEKISTVLKKNITHSDLL